MPVCGSSMLSINLTYSIRVKNTPFMNYFYVKQFVKKYINYKPVLETDRTKSINNSRGTFTEMVVFLFYFFM